MPLQILIRDAFMGMGRVLLECGQLTNVCVIKEK